jgi:2-isopropylmalate synthase
MDYVYLFDTTLRDGLQNADITCNTEMKQKYLDEVQKYNFDYTEIGMIDSLYSSDELSFKNVNNRILLALPRHENIKKALTYGMSSLHFVIKSDPRQIEEVLCRDKEEYINKCVEVLKASIENGIHTICSMEHFFDSFKKHKEFVMHMIKNLYSSGVSSISLADTNGGTLPHEIEEALDSISEIIPLSKVGMHTHDDMDLAVANSLVAVRKGVRLLQGTWNGMGERCGNMNLLTAFCAVMLKMGYKSCLAERLNEITASSVMINKIFMVNNNNLPFVGANAFSHKGGIHIDAILKNPSFYEHIDSKLVGNSNTIIMSDMIGTSSLISILGERPSKDFLPIAKEIIAKESEENRDKELRDKYKKFKSVI